MTSGIQQFAESFVTDLNDYHAEEKHYTPVDGKLAYSTNDLASLIGKSKTVLSSCEVKDTSGNLLGLSNVNMGHVTQPNELTGAFMKTLGWGKIRGAEIDNFLPVRDRFIRTILESDTMCTPLWKEGEEQQEQESEEEMGWVCKGCSKSFATKASLKRHHERKKSCKELCENPIQDVSGSTVPETPYIIDWVDQVLLKAISGESEKPYCKHCDVEFANKTNLHKHLSKSVACDKLAKQEFLKSLV